MIRFPLSWAWLRRRALLIAGLSLLGAVASCSVADDPLGTSRSEIINGSPASNADARDSGIVFVNSAVQQDGFVISGSGSGTLLDNRWVLTAAHVVERATVPSEVTVRRGNVNDSTAEVRTARRFAIHHAYVRRADPTPFTVDVALIELESPFTGSFSNTLSSLFTPQMVAGGSMSCFGYGRTSCNGSTGALHFGIFTPVASAGHPDEEFSLNQAPMGTPIAWRGDSGGPCVSISTGEIFGVMRASQCDGSADASVTSVEAFRAWAPVIRESLWSVRANFDGDNLPDTGAVRYDAPSFSYVVTIFFGSGGFTAFPLPAVVPPPVNVRAAADVFDADALADTVLLVGGQLYSFTALGGGLFTPQIDFFPIATNYEEVATADVNDDGFGDLEAIRDDGTVDIYFGSEDGLRPGLAVSGMPTADGSDGRFMALVGSDPTLETPERQFIQTIIAVEPGQDTLDVQIFDGDTGATSTFDTGDPGNALSCYNLWESPDGADYGGFITGASDVELGDAVWTTLYSGDAVGPASESGVRFYILESYLADGDCDDVDLDVAGAFLNTFKVRATGQVGVAQSDLSFIAYDVHGDWARGPEPPDTVQLDTSFDGTFSFFMDIPASGTEILLRDSDADIRTDDDPGNSPRGDGDVQADGVAVGVSDVIGYTLSSPFGVEFTNTNPSGNNDEVTDTDVEEVAVATGGVAGIWEWEWTGVFTHNDVRIWAPFASPTTYEIFGQPTVRLSPAPSRAPAYWLTNPRNGADLLPIRLGLPCDSIRVSRRGQMVEILEGGEPSLGGAPEGKVTVCRPSHHGRDPMLRTVREGHVGPFDDPTRPEAVAALASELLAAKLNVRRSARSGARLFEAFVYGRDVTVAQTLAEADALFSGISLERDHRDHGRSHSRGMDHDPFDCHRFEHHHFRGGDGHDGHFDSGDFDCGRRGPSICMLSPAELSPIRDVTVRLRAINLGEVTYVGPASERPTPRAPGSGAMRRASRQTVGASVSVAPAGAR